MHIITYTYRSGTTRHIKFDASQINSAFAFIRALRNKGISFKHVFEE